MTVQLTVQRIDKRPWEEIFRYHQFRRTVGSGWLNSSETIASIHSITCREKETGTDTTSDMISNEAVYSGDNTSVIYMLKGGTPGIVYVINFKIISSNGQKFEDELEVLVK
jgi:hypothetical protein